MYEEKKKIFHSFVSTDTNKKRLKKFTAKSFVELDNENVCRPSPPVVDDETNDDSHKTDPTPAKPIILPTKRKQRTSAKVLKDDSDFEVDEEAPEDEKEEEAVDDFSEQDDFVERTQNAKKN